MTQAKTLPLWAVNLRKYREQQGYTQATFGEKFGVKQQSVAQWEAATSEPPVKVLAWVLEASGTVEAGIFFKGGVEL